MILKLLISLIFVAAAIQKFTGKVAPNRERWGRHRDGPTHIALTALTLLLVMVQLYRSTVA
jgi:hypothetical protein